MVFEKLSQLIAEHFIADVLRSYLRFNLNKRNLQQGAGGCFINCRLGSFHIKTVSIQAGNYFLCAGF